MARPRMGVLICLKGAGKGKPYNSVEQMLKEWHPVYWYNPDVTFKYTIYEIEWGAIRQEVRDHRASLIDLQKWIHGYVKELPRSWHVNSHPRGTMYAARFPKALDLDANENFHPQSGKDLWADHLKGVVVLEEAWNDDGSPQKLNSLDLDPPSSSIPVYEKPPLDMGFHA
jgi:hypothetical protein